MPTITNGDLINTLIKNDGNYEGDPQAMAILEYKNYYHPEETIWFVAYNDGDLYRALNSPFVVRPKIIWWKAKKRHTKYKPKIAACEENDGLYYGEE